MRSTKGPSPKRGPRGTGEPQSGIDLRYALQEETPPPEPPPPPLPPPTPPPPEPPPEPPQKPPRPPGGGKIRKDQVTQRGGFKHMTWRS